MTWKVDILRLAVQLLPALLRGAALAALLRVLVTPLCHLRDRMVSLRDRTAARLDTTAAVLQLEKALADAFFLDDGQIFISTPDGRSTPVLRFKAEGQLPAYWHEVGGTPYYISAAEEAFYDAAFVVHVPTFLCTDLDAAVDKYAGQHLTTIRTILNAYKPAGRTYRIELYDYD